MTVVLEQPTDSTLEAPRNKLWSREDYHRADFWIVNFVDMPLEVRRQPDTAIGAYPDIRIYKRGESVAPLAAGGTAILIDDLLP